MRKQNLNAVFSAALGILTLLLVAVMLLGQTGVAFAHARLKSATVLPDATLATAPTSLALTFTEETSATQTKLQVVDSAGKQVDKGDLKVSGDTATISLNPLAEGKYTVKFRSFSDDDGHTVDGEYSFTVAKSGTAAVGSVNGAKQTEGQAQVQPTAAPKTGNGATYTDATTNSLGFGLGFALVGLSAVVGLLYWRRRYPRC